MREVYVDGEWFRRIMINMSLNKAKRIKIKKSGFYFLAAPLRSYAKKCFFLIPRGSENVPRGIHC